MLKLKREIIQPNKGFVKSLKKFEDFLIKNEYNLDMFD
jgi:hypothetical protein